MDTIDKEMASFIVTDIMALDSLISGKLDKEGTVSYSGAPIAEHRAMVKWHDGFRHVYAGAEADPMKRPLREVDSGEELLQCLNKFFE